MDIADAGPRFAELVEIMRVLRSPQGCAWDREQTLASLKPFLIEEVYELIDAIDQGDVEGLREELGDVLFEVVFLAQVASDEHDFTISDAAFGIAQKLIRRHPHVFTADGRPLGESGTGLSPHQVVRQWEELKAEERATAKKPEKTTLSGVPRALPALLRAHEISTRAAAVGFDWSSAGQVLEKVDEELTELRAAVTDQGASSAATEEELGDLLFTIANVGRKLGVEPEGALRKATEKFQRRFEAMERAARNAETPLPSRSPAELDALWRAAKAAVADADRASSTRS